MSFFSCTERQKALRDSATMTATNETEPKFTPTSLTEIARFVECPQQLHSRPRGTIAPEQAERLALRPIYQLPEACFTNPLRPSEGKKRRDGRLFLDPRLPLAATKFIAESSQGQRRVTASIFYQVIRATLRFAAFPGITIFISAPILSV